MDGIGTCHERLCRDASRVHTRAAKFVSLDDSDGFASTRKPHRQRGARLARPDNDCVKVFHEAVVWTWIMQAAYQRQRARTFARQKSHASNRPRAAQTRFTFDLQHDQRSEPASCGPLKSDDSMGM